jgi:hypothetical protein
MGCERRFRVCSSKTLTLVQLTALQYRKILLLPSILDDIVCGGPGG